MAKVAWIGLGVMGYPMARSYPQQGRPRAHGVEPHGRQGRSLGQGVLPAQANRGEEPYGRGQSPGQCVGAHSRCRLEDEGTVSNNHL